MRGDEAALAGMASALTFYSVGMAFVSVNTLLNRAFYSIQTGLAAADRGSGQPGAQRRARPPPVQAPGGGRHHAVHVDREHCSTSSRSCSCSVPRIGGVDARRVAWSAVRSVIALVPLCGVAYEVWWAAGPGPGARPVGADRGGGPGLPGRGRGLLPGCRAPCACPSCATW